MWAYLTAEGTLPLLRAWRQRSELRDVLEQRPHAGSEDPDLVHDLFAVTVEDDGWLYTWRYRPLRVGRGAGAGAGRGPGPAALRGRGDPRARASTRATRRGPPSSSSRRRRARPRREALAAAQAAHVVERADAATSTSAEEARTTAAALQRSTGQRSRRS